MSKTPLEQAMDAVRWIPTPPPEGMPTGDLPYQTHEGVLKIGDCELRVVQLNNGMRLIDQGDFDRFFGEFFGAKP